MWAGGGYRMRCAAMVALLSISPASPSLAGLVRLKLVCRQSLPHLSADRLAVRTEESEAEA